MIYFDNAATTLHKPPCVIEAVCSAMSAMGNSGRGAHDDALNASRVIYETRREIAELFGCPHPSNVAFTSNSTEALNTAIFGLLAPGDHVISTDLEHNSVLRPLYALQSRGLEVDFLPADGDGEIDCGSISGLVRKNTRAIVCTHASNLTGNLTDLARIGRCAHEHGLLLIVDASQTAGTIPIDMGTMGISVLCFTGHKSMMGPQGIGGLCTADGISIRPLKVGGTGFQTYLEQQPEEMPTRLEAGTLNGHGIAGLGAAVQFLKKTGLETIHAHERALMRRFYEGIRNIPGIRIYGNFSAERAPIVAMNLGSMPSGELADILSGEYGIATRPGAHCAPRMHVALGTKEQGAVRFSFGYYNTPDEVDAGIDALRRIAQ